jgi:hypothetical protein
MKDLSSGDFNKMMKNAGDTTLPAYVEVKTPEYRAVAKNFFQLPIGLLIALKEANLVQDGSDILILFDAAELGFEEDDFDRLQDLSISNFFTVIQTWLNSSVPK